MKAIPLVIQDVILYKPNVFGDIDVFSLKASIAAILKRLSVKLRAGQPLTLDEERIKRFARSYPAGKAGAGRRAKYSNASMGLHRRSTVFGQWAGPHLSSENKNQLWMLEGFTYSYWVLSEKAELLYKPTDYCAPKHERCIRWDDTKIDWPLDINLVLSTKNAMGYLFFDVEVFA